MTNGAGGPSAFPALAARFGTAIDPHDPVAIHRHAVRAVDLLFEGLQRAPGGPVTASRRQY
jgi:hypothetical protein